MILSFIRQRTALGVAAALITVPLAGAALLAPTHAASAADGSTASAITRPEVCQSPNTVIKSVFSPDGDVDNSLTINHNPTATTATDEADRFGEIEIAQGSTLTVSGEFSKYTTSRPLGGTFNVNTTIIAASPSGIGGDFDPDLIGVINTSTDPISQANNGGKLSYIFKATNRAEVGKTYIAYFHHTLMGNSDSPINTGGNTNHLFYTGFRVKVVAPKNCAPIVYDANGGTIKGQPTYTDAVASTGTSITTRTSLLTEEPIRDGYTFVNWTNSTTLLGTTCTYTYKAGQMSPYGRPLPPRRPGSNCSKLTPLRQCGRRSTLCATTRTAARRRHQVLRATSRLIARPVTLRSLRSRRPLLTQLLAMATPSRAGKTRQVARNSLPVTRLS